MSNRRYVVECMWSGYTSEQRRPCHRQVTTSQDFCRDVHQVVFTDGTRMSVSVRPCLPREKVVPILGYVELLRDIDRLGLTGSVSINDVDRTKMPLYIYRSRIKVAVSAVRTVLQRFRSRPFTAQVREEILAAVDQAIHPITSPAAPRPSDAASDDQVTL